jgi:AAA15 family ATPase/GTPase
MKYSIFHTSRCGSTLLACLLSKSIPTLAEPSWSRQPIENIDFEKNHTNLIIGTNGAGKSTMLDALCFVLFNKPFRKINKPILESTILNPI